MAADAGDVTQAKETLLDPHQEAMQMKKLGIAKVGFSGGGVDSVATTTADGTESMMSFATSSLADSYGMQTWRTDRRHVTGELIHCSKIEEVRELDDDGEQDIMEEAMNRAPKKVMCSPSLGPPGLFAQADLPSIGSQDHGTGACKPCAWFWKPGSCTNGRECQHCHMCPAGEIKNRKKTKKGIQRGDPGLAEPCYLAPLASSHGSDSEDEDAGGEQSTLSTDYMDIMGPPPGLTGPLPIARTGEESVGSAKHGIGECRPCAWFWKPKSCSNGKDCMHCHLCPEDELKRRKKVKQDSLRSSVGGESPSTRASQNQKAPRVASSSPTPPTLMLPQDMAAPLIIDETDLPSSGSALHALGKCKPCAWFHKPQGCINGKECCHCHVCSEGELKGRRRAKENAMRAGGLLPAKGVAYSPQSSRTMHVLKIFPLI